MSNEFTKHTLGQDSFPLSGVLLPQTFTVPPDGYYGHCGCSKFNFYFSLVFFSTKILEMYYISWNCLSLQLFLMTFQCFFTKYIIKFEVTTQFLSFLIINVILFFLSVTFTLGNAGR